MKTCIVLTTIFALAAATLIIVSPMNSAQLNSEPSPTLNSELIKDIQKVSEKHGLSVVNVMDLFARISCETPAVAIGSIGAVRDELYVETTIDTNRIIIGKKSFDIGNASGPMRLAVVSRDRILTQLDINESPTNGLAFVLFTPDRIHVYDWERSLRRFYYRR